MLRVTAETELRVTPNLIVWPGDSIRFGRVENGSLIEGSIYLLPGSARVLRAFSTPTMVRDAFHSVSSDILSALSECVEQGLLVPSTDDVLERSAKYDGFYLIDPWPSTERRSLMQRTSRHVKVSGKSIFVLDDVLWPSRRASIYRWLSQLSYLFHDADTPATIQYRHWIAPFSPTSDYCSTVPFLEFLVNVGREIFRGCRLTPCRAHAYCVPYGDVAFAHSDFDDDAGVTVLYFGNTMWPEEWGAEMLFYGESGEPEVAVAPRPGRLVVFRGEIRHRGGAPNRLSHEPRYTVVIRLTLDGTNRDSTVNYHG